MYSFILIVVIVSVGEPVQQGTHPSRSDVMVDEFLTEAFLSSFNMVVIRVNFCDELWETILESLFKILDTFREFERLLTLEMHNVVVVFWSLVSLLLPLRISSREHGHLDLMESLFNPNIMETTVEFILYSTFLSFACKVMCGSSSFTILLKDEDLLSILSQHRSRLKSRHSTPDNDIVELFFNLLYREFIFIVRYGLFVSWVRSSETFRHSFEIR